MTPEEADAVLFLHVSAVQTQESRHDANNRLDDVLASVVAPVLDELRRASTLHTHWPSDPLHAVAILAEELGELTQKLLQATYEPKKQVTLDAIREEAVQVAAMGLRFLVNFDRYRFPAAAGSYMTFAPPLPEKTCGEKGPPGGDPCIRPEGHTGPCAH